MITCAITDFCGRGRTDGSFRAPVTQRFRVIAHLRNLLSDLRRIENELERIRVLVLFHELQVHKTFRLRDRLTTGEPAPTGVEQRGCKLPFAICAEAVDG